ncbi:HXXXD-type acyl-transferase family protein, putative [Theobroma cacao]|uniref:HXXXD-type acyl-transferase family protein, putative n=1 Tax=Theobroma cacao TaxID=3641 RepID=A0A061EIW2_THECC|nr:HXXXD-type acyl-transferase family protein, putative [Theobroma cacao]
MAVLPDTLKVLEDTYVFPPPGSVPTTSLPLTFFDIHWLGSSPMQRLLFYDFPYPTFYFTQSTLPNLKRSLSLTLQHFFPLAGNLVFPPPPQKPYILYKEGDSVPFIAKESTADFSHLIGDHARHVQEFQALLPKLKPASTYSHSTTSTACMQKPLMAIQVTLFPKAGICVGATFNHVAADGKAFTHFMKSWASAHRSQGDLMTCLNKSLPDYNKDWIKDPLGLASIFMKDKWNWEDLDSIPYDKFRVTFVIKRSQVELLKNWVTRKCMEENGSETLRTSTFVVTCAYMWVCLVQLRESGTHDLSSTDSYNMLCHFIFLADCRDRLKLPATYFGNCLEPRFAAAKKSELLGGKGILLAAKAIGREVMELEKGALREAEKWLSRAEEIFKFGRHVCIAASPKLRVYETDFGWGRPIKTEVAHIGSFGSISMAESREEEGGVEFGLALAQDELDSFNAVFEQGLLKLQ